MRNLFAARISNRLVQLFGRINRGRNDYGVFLISGNNMNTWLNNDRNLALLPDLLQQQVKLGQYVQEGMKINNGDKVREIIDTVLNRVPEWLKFYADNLAKGVVDKEKSDRADQIETALTEAALSEAEYTRAMWDGDLTAARIAIDRTIEQTGRADPLLAGWHYIWLGYCYQAEGDTESARSVYRNARQRLGVNIALPTIVPGNGHVDMGAPLTSFGAALDRIVSFTSAETHDRVFGRLRSQLRDLDGATPRRMEESVRVLGEALGFLSRRPDNDVGTGPDVLWLDEETREGLAFELKTDKNAPALYAKKDISQGHDHIEWVGREYEEFSLLGLLYIGPEGRCHRAANPSDQMWLNGANKLADLRDLLFAQIEDIRRALPLERPVRIRDVSAENRWALSSLSESLLHVRMTDIHD